MPTVVVIFGTRPEAIKVAPVIKALRADPRFRLVTVATAQHRQMLDQVLRVFDIVPDIDLDLLTPGQTLTDLTRKLIGMLSGLMPQLRPDIVLVQGDTTTAFVGALAAYYHQVPVAHLEAGLRTGDPWAPFPEEGNRRLIAALAQLHLAPTPSAANNLLAENTKPEAVVVTGNTVIDALLDAVPRAEGYGDPGLAGLDEHRGRVLLVTAHRRESWGAPMRRLGQALSELARSERDLHIVIPVHRNPVVRDALLPPLAGAAGITVVEPLEYGGFCRLMNRSDVILTDSGGIQEEGPSLGKPVLVTRATTERPEGVAAGTARLIGTDPGAIVSAVRTLLHDPVAYARMATAVNPYGDGRAAHRVVAALAHHLGHGPAAEPFTPAAAYRHSAAKPAVAPLIASTSAGT